MFKSHRSWIMSLTLLVIDDVPEDELSLLIYLLFCGDALSNPRTIYVPECFITTTRSPGCSDRHVYIWLYAFVELLV